MGGDTFDDAYYEANAYGEAHDMEIMNDIEEPIDYLFSCIGGGGLVSGVGTYVNSISPSTKIIGCEPAGAPGMKASIENQGVVSLDYIDKFVDGAAVKRVG